MGTVDPGLATRLRQELGLERAVETGTYQGGTARALGEVFPKVVTIERSAELHRAASEALSDLEHVDAVQGHSVERLPELADPTLPTLYFLDGHWSSGTTAGSDDECPVLRELAAIGPGNELDCLIIDDARMFTAAPPPPHDPGAWPTLLEVIDGVRANHPDHHITLLDDQVISVPPAARAIVDAYGTDLDRPEPAGWRVKVAHSLLRGRG